MRGSISQIPDKVKESVFDYLHVDAPGGQQIVAAVMGEFKKLTSRSPKKDPTNLEKHMDFLENHVKKTYSESLDIDDTGNIKIGICSDSVLGFKENRNALRKIPTPVLWVVYLIRGIAGEYAFIDPDLYLRKKGNPMPAVEGGGFLISREQWDKEGWSSVATFAEHRHPASNSPPVPFFRNALRKADIHGIVAEALKRAKAKVESLQ
jgi:hypothetical protein